MLGLEPPEPSAKIWMPQEGVDLETLLLRPVWFSRAWWSPGRPLLHELSGRHHRHPYRRVGAHPSVAETVGKCRFAREMQVVIPQNDESWMRKKRAADNYGPSRDLQRRCRMEAEGKSVRQRVWSIESQLIVGEIVVKYLKPEVPRVGGL